MRNFVILILIAALGVSGCSYLQKNRKNPNATPGGVGAENPLIPEQENLISFKKKKRPYTGSLIDHMTKVDIKPVSGGKMLLVEGLTLRQGAFDIRLVNENTDGIPVNGVLTYSFRAYQPQNTAQGIQNTRMVDAGVFLSNKDLTGVSAIRVVAERNEQVVRP